MLARLAVGVGMVLGVAALAALELEPLAWGVLTAVFLLAILLVARAFQRSLTWPIAAMCVVLAAGVGAIVAFADLSAPQVVLYGLIGLIASTDWGDRWPSFSDWWDRLPGPSKDPADYR
ncbi:hypothetical protein LRS13_17840 [Svornostia abyssi]|uniref:Uncharacterized protein n=1 Tax=Svornostia abyssi TaxID=2898438 RepID=A0ABY5PD56_9ACTN|nr:hypothetical protein LRS13_17840 [Parviterribacteraceae bacterium J379]